MPGKQNGHEQELQMSADDLPRPPWMSKKHREYLHRMMVRRGILIIRLGTSHQKDKQEIQKEADALEWAIEILSSPMNCTSTTVYKEQQ